MLALTDLMLTTKRDSAFPAWHELGVKHPCGDCHDS